nr:MAG TPA: hypothetical protein [Herelleviridae sp.]
MSITMLSSLIYYKGIQVCDGIGIPLFLIWRR